MTMECTIHGVPCDMCSVCTEEVLDAREKEIAGLKEKATRWYQADGSFIELPEAEVIEKRKEAAKALARMRDREEALKKGLRAVESLINDSHGVAGLHLNGDVAPWDELRTDGKFEEWLKDFDAALSALKVST
jgi:hypothetical protein